MCVQKVQVYIDLGGDLNLNTHRLVGTRVIVGRKKIQFVQYKKHSVCAPVCVCVRTLQGEWRLGPLQDCAGQ